jgi:hypothetical protein
LVAVVTALSWATLFSAVRGFSWAETPLALLPAAQFSEASLKKRKDKPSHASLLTEDGKSRIDESREKSTEGEVNRNFFGST